MEAKLLNFCRILNSNMSDATICKLWENYTKKTDCNYQVTAIPITDGDIEAESRNATYEDAVSFIFNTIDKLQDTVISIELKSEIGTFKIQKL
jgi:hypothetical protein